MLAAKIINKHSFNQIESDASEQANIRCNAGPDDFDLNVNWNEQQETPKMTWVSSSNIFFSWC